MFQGRLETFLVDMNPVLTRSRTRRAEKVWGRSGPSMRGGQVFSGVPLMKTNPRSFVRLLAGQHKRLRRPSSLFRPGRRRRP